MAESESEKMINLQRQYDEYFKLFRELEDSFDNEKLKTCKQGFQELGKLVNSLGIYSKNETHHDIHSSDLKFLLVPYYLAVLETKENEDRISHLKFAKILFGNFFQVLEMLEVLQHEDKEEAEVENTDPRWVRDQKIQRLRRQKEFEKQIEYLSKKREELMKNGEIDFGKDLDEIEREITFSQIHHAANQTFSEIRLIDQEIPLLEHMMHLKQTGQQFVRPDPPKQSAPPFTIYRDHRGELRSTVFRPHWIPPTYTVEQAAELEMQYMAKSGGPDSEKKKEEEVESDPDDDEEYRKKRDYDDWCDDHPRGSGNTMANIG